MSTKAAYIHIPFLFAYLLFTAILIKSFIEGQPVDEYIEFAYQGNGI